jgi:alkylation response protein AidB-like acyl-CoA dehydrogenase
MRPQGGAQKPAVRRGEDECARQDSNPRPAAREAGIFAPHAPADYGGAGLNMTRRAPVFEEAGYSLFGPLALNIAAPDEGNVHLLDQVASASQRRRYLAPLARGLVRSGVRDDRARARRRV